jgi:hypothetical protein
MLMMLPIKIPKSHFPIQKNPLILMNTMKMTFMERILKWKIRMHPQQCRNLKLQKATKLRKSVNPEFGV